MSCFFTYQVTGYRNNTPAMIKLYESGNNFKLWIEKNEQIHYDVLRNERWHIMAKYRQIADQIRTNIQNGSYQKMLPTEQALCEEFHAGRQTIRHALSLLQSEKLIDRRQGSGSYILDSAVSPVSFASSVPAAGTRLSIAIVATYISDYIFPSILREMEAVFSRNNSTPLLFATQNQVDKERRILQTLLEMDVLDGILVEGTKTGFPNPNLDLYRQLIDRNVPLVFFHGNYPELSQALSVLDDNISGGRMLVDYLYEKGHRRIAGVFKSDDIQGHQRYAGFTSALLDHHLEINDNNILWYDTELKQRILDGFFQPDITSQIMDGCSAVVCYNDEIASHIISNLVQYHIPVPGKMAVVSFDNSPYSEMSSPRITSLSHGQYNVGRMAAELLFQCIRGDSCHSLLAPWELIEKESS